MRGTGAAPALAGALLALGALALCPGVAVAEEPLALEVLDDATGLALNGVQAAIVDPERAAVRGRFEKGLYRGPRSPGDMLYVYRRGFDLHVAPLADGRRVAVRLRKATGKAVIVLADAEAAASGWRVSVIYEPARRWPHGPFRDVREVRPRGDRFEVVVPEGPRTLVLTWLDDRSLIRWPMGIRAKPGAEHVIRVDRGRELAVRWGEGVSFRDAHVLCVPDTLRHPGIDPHRLDAWRSHLNGPGWLSRELRGRARTLRVCPDVPFHLFARSVRTPVYRYVGPGEEEIDLRGPFPLRTVAARPVVGGDVLAEGAMLAPGRLHLDALSLVREYEYDTRGSFATLGPRHEPWGDVRLPASPWLTAWDPERGVAHLQWEEGGAPTGSYGPARIDIVVAPGFRGEGKVAVYPLWKATGRLRTMPPLDHLSRPMPEDGRLVFRGLPYGTYGVSIRIALRARATGHAVETGRWAELTVTRERPVREVRLPVR